jgi:hypothetical protein
MFVMLRRYDGLFRRSSAMPKFGVSMPLRRPLRTSWKKKGIQNTGTSPMYSTPGRATITFSDTNFMSFVVKWKCGSA